MSEQLTVSSLGVRGLVSVGLAALGLGVGAGVVGVAEALRRAPGLLLALGVGWGLAASVVGAIAWWQWLQARRGLLASLESMQVALRDQRRRHLEEAASERMASLGTLATGLAHEVNNPLTYVLSNLRLLVGELPELSQALRSTARASGWPDERVEDLAACIREALEGAERVRTVIHGFRTYTHSSEEPYCAVDVNTVVEGALRLALPELRSRARVQTQLGALPLVEGYHMRLGQVVLHLLMNAAHAIKPGAPECQEVRVRTWVEAGEVRVEVRDTGEGIAPQDMAHIFEPFFTTKKVGQGMGLGLWLCHNVVRAHGGRMTVESTLGQGSRFVVHLPLEQQEVDYPTEPYVLGLS